MEKHMNNDQWMWLCIGILLAIELYRLCDFIYYDKLKPKPLMSKVSKDFSVNSDIIG